MTPSRKLQRRIGRECLAAARASAVMPGAAALISAAIEARAAIEQAQAAAAAGGCWTDSFDRLGRPCRMFVPSEA
jgi:hypothetical protein